jgi:uncharacterized membrane protein YhaH (DUF805 family)
MFLSEKNYWLTTAVLFLLVSVLHGLRVLLGLELMLDGWLVPMWLSGVACVLTLCLSIHGFRYYVRSK